MARCIAFLRAVNVGGRIVKMDALRAEFEALGLARVETFIASGNVIFETRARDLGALERRIEAQLEPAFGFAIDTFVRSADELAAIAAHPAFDAAALAAAQTHVVGFFTRAPDAAACAAIARLNSAADRLHLNARELYWLSTNKQSESTFSNAALEKAAGLRSTLRSITTLHKLNAKIAGA
jgi:uncharacterized protein (DUF1697 family)